MVPASASGYPSEFPRVQPISGIGAAGQLACMLPSANRAGPHLRGSVVSPGTIPPGLICSRPWSSFAGSRSIPQQDRRGWWW